MTTLTATFGLVDTVRIMSENGLAVPKSMNLVVGECNLKIADPIQSYLTENGYRILSRVSTSDHLMALLARQPIHLLLLGELEGENCFAVFRDFRKRWPMLPVILISHQPVSDVFRDWVIQRGINDVFYSHPDHFSALSRAIVRNINQGAIGGTTPIHDLPISKTDFFPVEEVTIAFHGDMIKAALEELSQFSSHYFGTLALGNYWRKAYQKAIVEYSELEHWSVDYQGEFTLIAKFRYHPVAAEQLKGIKVWIQFFIQECERIIVDFASLLAKESFSPILKQLLPHVPHD